MTSWRGGGSRVGSGAGRALALGATGVAVYHAWCWRDDRRLATRLRADLERPRPVLQATPRVSILVAAWNEAEWIERHIESVLALSYPDTEYVLCAGGGDGTFETARRYAAPGVVILEQRAGEGKQRALRRAFEHCTGEIVYLTDADCIVADAPFERIIEPIVHGREVATTGGSMPLPKQLATSPFAHYQWAVQEYAAARSRDYVGGLLGRNAAVSRALLDRLDAFADEVATGTDFYLARQIGRAGYTIRHVPDSLVWSAYPRSLADYARQQRRWLRNLALLGPRLGAWPEAWGSLRTSLIGATMLLWPVAGAFFAPPTLVPWCLALLHSTLAKLRYLAFASVASGTPNGAAALLAPWLTLLEFGVWALPLLDYRLAQRRWQW